MRISSSNMVFLSGNQFEQMDASLNKKSLETSTEHSDRILSNNGGLSILVDRVSLSRKQTLEYQSNYSSSVTGRSSVTSMESSGRIEFEQQSAIEKMVGGVIDKKVAISHIQNKEDIFLSEEKRLSSNGPDSANTSVQAPSIQAEKMTLTQTDIHFEEETLAFSSQGEVTTKDGRKIDFSLEMSLDKTFLSRTERETIIKKWQERIDLTDPLVISLEGKTPQLSDAGFEFDLNNDGEKETVSFAASGSGFLAFDKNNDHVINNGSELFGPGTGNGFGELAVFDDDQNNWIDENDAVFSKLSVWTKDDTGKDTLLSLKDAGIGAISLNYADTSFHMTESDNTLNGQMKRTGMFLFENGNVGLVHQIDLAARPVEKNSKDSWSADNAAEQLTSRPFGDTLEPPMDGPGIIPSAIKMDESKPEDVFNPLKDLLDRIEELKKEMERLYEKMSQPSNQNKFMQSGRRHYQSLNLDPDFSTLLFDYTGPVRTKSRYA